MDMHPALTTFIDESRELLAQMEEILLRAEAGTAADDDLHALFRCAHTIKGSAGLFGLDAIVQFTHVVENALDRLRDGSLAFSPALTGLLFDCRDHVGALVGAVDGSAAEGTADAGGAALCAQLQQFLGDGPPATASAVAVPEAAVEVGSGVAIGAEHWHLSLRFGAEVFRNGMDPLAFINYLRNYGEIVHIETVADGLPELAHGDPERCHLGFELALRSDAGKAELESVFDFVHDDARITILPPHSRMQACIALIESLDEDRRRLGEMLVECGTLTRRELEAALAAQHADTQTPPPKLGEVLVGRGIVEPPLVHAALAKQKSADERRAAEALSVKVPADRLDALIDRVGELVIAGAAVQMQARGRRDSGLQETAAQLLRLVEDVRDGALRLRMTRVGEVFGRFPRVVRDLSRELGKDIGLVVRGAEAELDKSMVEKVGDPLMHLVRNAIDHGIEPPAQRAAAGKPARGTLTLNAYHESGSIVIEVGDDGGGLDTARILRKAVERGLVAADATPGAAEIHRLILEPGFSTAEQVTRLSGRGVGMDVVRSSIEALRGTLDIDSTPGAGTTMRLCLPLTLAIIDGFQVTVGASTFILPLDSVVECIELPAADAADYLNLRGEVLPFVRLRRLFALGDDAPARQNVVVVRFAGRKAGLVVDRLDGECQAVIKPLGHLFGRLSGIAGSTILGSGEVALILDVAQLLQQATGSTPAGASSSTAAAARR